MSATPALSLPDAPSTGGRLVTLDGKALPFRGGLLSADARGGLARVSLRQRFVNPHREPLRVTYTLPLPADGAVVGFAFELDGERIVGEIDGKARARERFEEALVEGRTAAILDQERSSVFTQEVGNVPPGAGIDVEILLDVPLRWVSRASGAAGGWELRFPTVVAPRFLGQPGRTPDADKVAVDVVEDGTPPRMGLALTLRDALTGDVTSPTHALVVREGEVSLAAEEGAALDRDLVVRWPVAAAAPGAVLDAGRPAVGWPGAPVDRSAHAYGLLTLVPPAQAAPDACRRDVIVLIDTSGSQAGMPMTQSKALTRALIESLSDDDTLELIEFSNRPRRWQPGQVRATAARRREALAWVDALQAGGATQMREGIEAALASIRDEGQRQVVLITDGLIGFESEIVERVRTGLPRGSRVHTVGVASGVNRSLTGPVARAGGGVELILDLDEDPAEAARRLVAATAAPQIVDVVIGGSALDGVACHRIPDLMAGQPTRVALRLDPAGGTLQIVGHSADGPWKHTITVPPVGRGEGSQAAATLYARECVEEAELEAACGRDVDAQIEALGLSFQISTRQTSWVAVSQAPTVDPRSPTRRASVPQALPYGMSAQGMGLRAASSALAQPVASRPTLLSMPAGAPAAPPSKARKREAREESKSLFSQLSTAFWRPKRGQAAPPAAPGADAIGDTDDDRADDRAAEVEVPEEVAEIVLDVRIYRFRVHERSVEFEAPRGGLNWVPAGVVRFVFDDGTVVEAKIETAVSTSVGHWPAGELVRAKVTAPELEGRSGELVRVEVPMRHGFATVVGLV